MNTKHKKKIQASARISITILLAIIICLASLTGGAAISNHVAHASTVNSGRTLSMVEMHNGFSTLVSRTSNHMTLIFVERLYFDYCPTLEVDKRLALTECERTEFATVEIFNEAGERAKVPTNVRREERGIRPDDASGHLRELNYLEINHYWEWRTFTNDERWNVIVDDGFNILNFTFDLAHRRDGVIYYIDGVFALPEKHYPQVLRWWDYAGDNSSLNRLRDSFIETVDDAYEATLVGEPFRLNPIDLTGNQADTNASQTTSNGAGQTTVSNMAVTNAGNNNGNNGNPNVEIEQAGFFLSMFGIIVLAAVVTVTFVAVSLAVEVVRDAFGNVGSASAQGSNDPNSSLPNNPITNPNDPRYGDTPWAPCDNQKNNHNEWVKNNPVSPELRRELEAHKEFTVENDAPSGQKVVRLMLVADNGVLEPVFDENGNQIYLHRASGVIGNSMFAIVSRRTNLPIVYNPATRQLADAAGNRYTVNGDNRLMNMEGREPFSFLSLDDVNRKLDEAGVFLSSVDPTRMLVRMDDCDRLWRMLHQPHNDIRVGFFDTIANAFRNVFSSNGTPRSFWQTVLDVLIIIAVFGIGGFLLVLFIIYVVKPLIKKAFKKR
jgi:hypothetical protein